MDDDVRYQGKIAKSCWQSKGRFYYEQNTATKFNKILENTLVEISQQNLKTLVLSKIALSSLLCNILLYNFNQSLYKVINPTELSSLFISVSAN